MKPGQKQFEDEAVTLTLQASSCCLNTSILVWMGSSSSWVPPYCPDQYQGTGRIVETHRHAPLLAAAAPAVEEWSRSTLHAISHTYMHTTTYAHRQTYHHKCTYHHMQVHPHHTHIHTHASTHTHSHTHTHKHTHTYTYTHTHIHLHTHPNNAGMIQTHTHTQTHTHRQTHSRACMHTYAIMPTLVQQTCCFQITCSKPVVRYSGTIL